MTREEKAYIKALRSRGVEVRRDYSVPQLQKGKPEDQVYSGGLLPEVTVSAYRNPDGTPKTEPIKEKSFGEYWKDFEKSKVGKFVDAKGLRQEKDFLLGQLGYGDTAEEGRRFALDAAAMVNPIPDFINAADQAQQGKYPDAALYLGAAAIPGSAGPIVNKVKKGWKEVRGRIKGLGTNIGDVVRDAKKTEDIILDKRMAAQNKAHASGVDWGERWAYDLDAPEQPLREGYLQKIIETRIKNSPNANYLTDKDIAEGAAERAKKNLNWAANNSGSEISKKLSYPEGPMGKSENILATWPNESNAALLKKDPYDFSSSGIDEPVQDYIARDHYVAGFKTYRENPKPDFETSAVTFRKAPKDLNLRSPEEIKATGTHEGHHNQQQILEWMDKLKASIQSSPTLKDSPLAYRIKKAMKVDEGPDASGAYDWFAQVNELHSELGVARMELADSWVKAGTFKNRNEAINFMQSPEFLKNDDYIKRLYDTLGGKVKNVSNVRVAGKPAKPFPAKQGRKFFKEETPMKDRLDILRGLPVAVPVVGVGAAAASMPSTSEMQRGGNEDLALNPNTGEVFLEQDKGVKAKEARVSKRAAKKEQEVLVTAPKFVPGKEKRSTATQQGLPYKHGGVESFNPNSRENLAYVKALRKSGVKVSSTGYKHDSPDRNNAANLIVGDDVSGTNLTMEGVPHGVRAIGSDTGKTVDMVPGVKNYSFPQDRSVMEVPLAQSGFVESGTFGWGTNNSPTAPVAQTWNMTSAPTVATDTTSMTGDAELMSGSPAGGGGGGGIGMSGALAIGTGVANVASSLAPLASNSMTDVSDVSYQGGSREAAVEGTIGGVMSAIPIVGQVYQIGSGIATGFEAGAHELYSKGNRGGGEFMSAAAGTISPTHMFGRNAELWEQGYLSDGEAAANFVLGFFGGAGASNVLIDRKVRAIQGQRLQGAMTRSTGGMHQIAPATADSAGKFSKSTGYPKPKVT